MKSWMTTLFSKFVSSGIILSLCFISSIVNAAVFTVNNTADAGVGSLRDAITQANAAAPGSLITFDLPATTTIPIGANFPLITKSMTIEGAGATGLILDGGGTRYVFFVLGGTVNISNLKINNALSQGGNGGTGPVGGGGGAMGAGAAIFVNNAGTSVTLTDVSFSGNKAVGGAGTAGNGYFTYIGGGGGGMLGGTGGSSVNNLGIDGGGGGGGFRGIGGNGSVGTAAGSPGGVGVAPIGSLPGGNGLTIGGSVGGAGGATGGGGGGGGAQGVYFGNVGGGGGGGINGQNALGSGVGGAGGDFGGGGGAGYLGGAVAGGIGGFGGGGGGGLGTGSIFGGGDGGQAPYGIDTGNGGGAFGAAVFVRNGGALYYKSSNTSSAITGSIITAGTGQVNGAARGADIFLNGGNTTFEVPLSFTQTLAGGIGDLDPNHPGASPAALITKIGSGKLIFTTGAVNSYRGGTNVTQGTLQGDFNSIQGNITNNAHVVFELTAGAGTYGVSNGTQNAGIISGTGDVTVHGAAGTVVTFASANTYTGGTIISGGTLQLNVVQALAASGSVSITAATAKLDLGGRLLTIRDLSGQGLVNLGANNTLTVDSPATTEFTGIIDGVNSGIIKNGLGTFQLKGANTYNGSTLLRAGSIQMGSGGSLTSNVTVGTATTSAILEMNGGSTTGTIAGFNVASAANATLLITGNFTPTNTITNIGAINVTGGIATFNAPAVLPTGFNTISISGTGEMILNTDFTNPVGKTITVGGASGKLTLSGGTLLNAGTLIVNTGGLVQTGTGQILTNQATGEIKLGGGLITSAISGIGASKLTVTGSSDLPPTFRTPC